MSRKRSAQRGEADEPLGPSARKQGLAVRAFFAVALDEALRESAAACARELAARPGGDGVRWVAPASYHLTLRFLGNVPSAEIAALAERAQDALAGCAPFALTFGAPLAFPTPRRPRVIALAAQPEDALAGLAALLEKAVVESGLTRAEHAATRSRAESSLDADSWERDLAGRAVAGAPEPKAFRAHLTLGRVRARRFPELTAPAPAGTQLVREVVLFRSDLGHDGAHYSPLATLALGAGAAAGSAHSPH